MTKLQALKHEAVRKILGKVEVETVIKKMEGRKLKQTERNYLYRSIRPKLVAAGILAQENILEEINKDNREDASAIEYNLSRYGYEMISLKKKKGKIIPIEELIVKILAKFPTARFIESIPVLIIKNRIDKFKLLELASNYGIKNKIGYLLETALMIKPMDYLKDLLSYCYSNRDDEVSFLAEGDYEFLSKKSPARVRKWKLLGRFFDEDFIKNAKVYL
ncbi:hypothetical protein HYW20_09110 [Candidatus Woesearchaeota archaeon]|nr:hypothetical protein [Candidatus Woesearchaeota archaeon]